jgi:hypothetical protein
VLLVLELLLALVPGLEALPLLPVVLLELAPFQVLAPLLELELPLLDAELPLEVLLLLLFE